MRAVPGVGFLVGHAGVFQQLPPPLFELPCQPAEELNGSSGQNLRMLAFNGACDLNLWFDGNGWTAHARISSLNITVRRCWTSSRVSFLCRGRIPSRY